MPRAAVLSSLSRYLVGDMSIEDFERSLPDGWELDQERDASLRHLVLRLMADIGQYARAELSEDELRSRLAPLASWANFRIIVEEADAGVAPARTVTAQSSGAGRRREVAPA